MKTLIINLPTSTDRRAFQEHQMSQLGLDFEWINAVSTSNIPEEQYHCEAFGWQRPLRRVELACFLSHVHAWERIVQLQQPCVILEDDALLSVRAPSILSCLDEYINHSAIDMINLENRSRKKIVGRQPSHRLHTGDQLFKLYQDRTGTGGYILTPTGAKILLQAYQTMAAAPSDAFITSCYQLDSYQIEPAALIQMDQVKAYQIISSIELPTVIGRSEAHKTTYASPPQKLKFKLRRLIGQVRMGWRHLSHLHHAKKRFIELVRSDFDLNQQASKPSAPE